MIAAGKQKSVISGFMAAASWGKKNYNYPTNTSANF